MGHRSTVDLLGSAVPALFRHPEQLRVLRERPDLMPAAEGFLRHGTFVERSTGRYAARDVELAGVRIPRGGDDRRRPWGRPATTPRSPTASIPPYSMWPGRACVMETAVALRMLLSRLPELELAVPADALGRIGSGIIRGVLSLPGRYRVA
ncbi:cytochrome P450 [Streptomyces roseirectus]|uniref:cytochrome P450 n=1 Tax=Streptomyces roseirectus TaxID=2768066 RepID=UPI001FED1D65|nr:cytochrome P450 [Streptomyces roseirectus]